MATQTEAKYRMEDLKPALGSRFIVDKENLLDPEVLDAINHAIEDRGVLIFPKLNLDDKEQLELTDALGGRVNFTKTVAGGDANEQDVYTITLDKDLNNEPEYVLGTFFWHMDGITIDMPPPRATILSCRKKSATGGQTQFASTYAAYDALSDEEKAEFENIRVKHSVVAAVREVAQPEDLEPFKRGISHVQPLVWTHDTGRKSLIVGYTADEVEGQSKAHGRALLARLLEWTAQPDFSYSHDWEEGDLVIWDNCGALHRVIPYEADSGRTMHRTTLAGSEAVS